MFSYRKSVIVLYEENDVCKSAFEYAAADITN